MEQGEYILTGYRKAWAMWDLDNGDPSKGSYMWVFPTKKAALEHKRKYKSSKNNFYTRLSKPIKIEL